VPACDCLHASLVNNTGTTGASYVVVLKEESWKKLINTLGKRTAPDFTITYFLNREIAPINVCLLTYCIWMLALTCSLLASILQFQHGCYNKVELLLQLLLLYKPLCLSNIVLVKTSAHPEATLSTVNLRDWLVLECIQTGAWNVWCHFQLYVTNVLSLNIQLPRNIANVLRISL